MPTLKFYTANLRPGILVDFMLEIEVPEWGGVHQCRGSIIHSKSREAPMVIWPKDQTETYFSHIPERSCTPVAENWILAEWWDWKERGPGNKITRAS